MNHEPRPPTTQNGHEPHEPPTIKAKPWPPTNETTHNPRKSTSDEERSLQPPTNDDCPPRQETGTTAHEKQGAPIPRAHEQQHKTGTNDDNCPLTPTTHKQRPPSTTTTARPQNQRTTRSTHLNHSRTMTAHHTTLHDRPRTTRQRHGTCTAITHTGVHALHPSYHSPDLPILARLHGSVN
jgi:hypothetical protein